MQAYDWAMIGVVLFATLLGYIKGMARQVASLASLVVSSLAAARFSPDVAERIDQPEPMNRLIAMLSIYLVTSLAIWLVYRQCSRLIERVQLKEFDRQAGGLLGAAKGMLLCAVVTVCALMLSSSSREVVRKSRSGPFFTRLAAKSLSLLPDGFARSLGRI